MQAFGLYTHIRANKIRSAILIGLLFGLVYVLVFAAGLIAEALAGGGDFALIVGRALADLRKAAPWATLGTVLWVAVAYALNQRIVDAVTGARPVTRRDEPRLYNLVENLCLSRGLPVPRLEIMESDVLNAYATGLNERQYAITVTRGLLDALNDAELEAVLAHELTHIRNGDVRLMVIAIVVAGIISFFGELAFRWFAGGPRLGRSSTSRDSDDRKGSGGAFLAIALGFVLIAVAWFLSQFIRFALSRSREFLADAGSVELTKNPDAMIAALRKVDGRGELPNVPSGLMEMCLDNPRSGFADLFATHPSIAARIQALVRFGGGDETGGPAAPIAVQTSRRGPWGSVPAGTGDQATPAGSSDS